MPDKLLLQIRDLHKNYGEKIIFDGASVSIVEKQKIGVIGRNGAGKSTLFKMIMGDEETDLGTIEHLPDLRLGYIPQVDPFTPDEIVLEFLQRYTGKEDWECAKVASQFQLKNDLLKKKIGDLSGGFQMRVKLTATLLFEPNLLLLDEPTNYLDLSTLILLEKFLKSFRGGFLCITHDREFIKKTCTSTMEVEHGQIVLYPEPLEEYLEYKEEQKVLAASANKTIEAKQKQLKTFVDRFGSKASMAKSAQSKIKQIDRLENKKIGIAHALSTVQMHIPPVIERTGVGLTLDKLTIGYPGKVVATGISLEAEKGKKVAILGDNGQGKSTLLKTMAGFLDPVSGTSTWAAGLKVAFYAQHVNLALDPEENVEKYLRRMALFGTKDDVIFRMMGNFLFKKIDSQKTIGVMSGGEKARLCLAGMFLTGSDVLLLDEPTNHLDFETVEAMGAALGKFNGSVFVVSHDRTFVNLIASEIWEVGGGLVKRVLGSYEDYVWQKEQQAEMESSQPASISGSSQPTANTPRDLSKEQRKRLYELNKELGKIEKKLETLKASGGDASTTEVKWLEITTEIEGLS
jgi:ATP-binding cassette, subfamily F, member 3